MLIAIDPGATGAIALKDPDDRVFVDDMPETIGDLWEYLFTFYPENNCICYLEKVGGYMPGNSGPASVKFAKHIGHLEMALYGAKIPCTKVPPQTWMKAIGVPAKLEKTQRKNWIKDYVQRQFPGLKIKVSQADALGILCYALKIGR